MRKKKRIREGSVGKAVTLINGAGKMCKQNFKKHFLKSSIPHVDYIDITIF